MIYVKRRLLIASPLVCVVFMVGLFIFFFFEESQFHEKDPKPTQKRKTALQNGRGQKGLLVMKQ